MFFFQRWRKYIFFRQPPKIYLQIVNSRTTTFHVIKEQLCTKIKQLFSNFDILRHLTLADTVSRPPSWVLANFFVTFHIICNAKDTKIKKSIMIHFPRFNIHDYSSHRSIYALPAISPLPFQVDHLLFISEVGSEILFRAATQTPIKKKWCIDNTLCCECY